MATRAIGAYRLLVHIRMAGNAGRSGLGKYQGLVTNPAIHRLVSPGESKICFIVVKAG